MAKSFRKRFMFWLDLNKRDEQDLAEQIDELKEQRGFAKAIRDGLRLLIDLRRGNVDVLLELFPDIRHRLVPDGHQSGGGNLEKQMDTVLTMLTQLNINGQPAISAKPKKDHPPLLFRKTEQQLEQQPAIPLGGLFKRKHTEEVDVVVTVRKASADEDNSSSNFLNSLMALNG